MHDADVKQKLRIARDWLLGICGVALGSARIWMFGQSGASAYLVWGVCEVCIGAWFLRRAHATARAKRHRRFARSLSNDR